MCHTKGTSGLWGGSNRENKGGKGWGESKREGKEGLLLKDSFQNILFNPP